MLLSFGRTLQSWGHEPEDSKKHFHYLGLNPFVKPKPVRIANRFRAGLVRETKMTDGGWQCVLTFCKVLLHIFVVYVVLTAILSI